MDNFITFYVDAVKCLFTKQSIMFLVCLCGVFIIIADLNNDFTRAMEFYNEKKSISTLNEIVPNVESICLTKDFVECFSFDKPRTARIETLLLSGIKSKTYKISVSPITQ